MLVLFPAYLLGLAVDNLTLKGSLISDEIVKILDFFGMAVDNLDLKENLTPDETNKVLGQIDLYILGIFLSAMFSGLLMILMRRKIVIASRQTEYEIRRDLFSHMQTLDKHYYDRARTGDLMNRLTGDLMAVREMMGFGVWQSVNIVVGFSMAFGVLLAVNWQLTLLVIAIVPIIVWVLAYMARLIVKRHRLVQEQNSLISAMAQENFSGARVVKGYAIEDREVAKYKEMNLELLKRNIQLIKVEGPMRSFAGLLLGLAFGVVLYAGGRLILQPEATFTPGKLTQFLLTLERLAWPMILVGWTTGIIQRGSASWVRLREIFDARPLVTDEPTRIDTSIQGIKGDVVFEDVQVEYESKKVLKDINLHIPAGTFLGITGPTGSGKTVLAQLMVRSMDPTSGVVYVDGHDVRSMTLDLLRKYISIVPQEPFLFSDTIANNISFGVESIDLPEVPTGISVVGKSRLPKLPQQPNLEHVKKAARLAGLDGDIEDFPNQYQTILGERGVTLSGGQRQRTAIARAIVREPQILILDDSLSAVDTETESRILEGLREVSEGRTVVLIGHRISTLRQADHIVVLEDGEITEQGSHKQLIEQNGHYAELERLQKLAQDLEEESVQESQLSKVQR